MLLHQLKGNRGLKIKVGDRYIIIRKNPKYPQTIAVFGEAEYFVEQPDGTFLSIGREPKRGDEN